MDGESIEGKVETHGPTQFAFTFRRVFPPDKEFQKKSARSSFYHTETDLR
jgi:hypothetical protein